MVVQGKIVSIRNAVGKNSGKAFSSVNVLLEGRYVVEAVVFGAQLEPALMDREVECSVSFAREGYKNVAEFRIPSLEGPRASSL